MMKCDIDIVLSQEVKVKIPESLKSLLSAPVSSVDNILSIYENLSYFRTFLGYKYLFRGHSSSSYCLLPSIGRTSKIDIKKEYHILDEFKKICKTTEYYKFKPEGFNEDLYYMSIARHLGLKSRLLDWTAGFWEALSFLLYDNKEQDGTLWIMAQRSNIFIENKSPLEISDDSIHFFKEICVIPENKLLHDIPLGVARSYRQHSYFTATSIENSQIPLNKLKCAKDIEFYNITISPDLKRDLAEYKNVIDVDYWLYLRQDDTLIYKVLELNKLFED